VILWLLSHGFRDKGTAMRQEYDFSNAKKNPYASQLNNHLYPQL
jgi:hypothetical protein